MTNALFCVERGNDLSTLLMLYSLHYFLCRERKLLSCHRFPCVPSFRAPIALCNFGALKNKE